MAITYNWAIERMDCIPVDGEFADVVVTAYWRCFGVDGEFLSTTYGTCNFSTPGDTFTPYNELTESQVLGWCWANGVDKDAQEAIIAADINRQITPPIITPPLPW